MDPQSPLLRLLLLLLLLIAAFPALISLSSATSPTTDDLVAELETLRTQSPSGVIHLDDRSVGRFLTSAPIPRPYSLIVFFDASQLRSKPDLHLPQLRSEFALVSSTFASHHASSPDTSLRVFFCDIEFQESQASFSLFGVTSLPHVHHAWPASLILGFPPSGPLRLRLSALPAPSCGPAQPLTQPSVAPPLGPLRLRLPTPSRLSVSPYTVTW